MRGVPAPRLEPGRIVAMDNLSVRGSEWVGGLIEGKGCGLWPSPPRPPGFNAIEQAFPKVEGLVGKAKARALEALFEATRRSLWEVAAKDARGYFGHCGCKAPRAQ